MGMNLSIGNDWDEILAEETDKEYFARINEFIEREYAEYTVYPPRSVIYSALKYVPFSDVKVVIVGQDPYINPGQANGLAFAVADGITLPPSLRNIYKEIESDLGVSMKGKSGELTGWAKQGVLLLNATLTVRASQSNAHAKCGWQEFTDSVIHKIGQREKPAVFILWGRNARSKVELIAPHHCVIESAHPSPMSATQGFFGSKPFSRANAFLSAQGLSPIDWEEVSAIELPKYYSGTGVISRA